MTPKGYIFNMFYLIYTFPSFPLFLWDNYFFVRRET